MQRVDFDGTFAGWRKEARRLLQAGIAPAQVSWQESRGLGDLFDEPVEATARRRVAPYAFRPNWPRPELRRLLSQR